MDLHCSLDGYVCGQQTKLPDWINSDTCQHIKNADIHSQDYETAPNTSENRFYTKNSCAEKNLF